MKKLTISTLILAIATLVGFTGCSTSQKTAQSSDQSVAANTGSDYWTLEDYLRRINGVQVRGSGNNTYLSIRGPNSIGNPDAQPLFIVNGQKVGRDYSFVNGLFSPGQIKSVRVLPASQTSMYGMEGNYGIILIQTKAKAHVVSNRQKDNA